MRKHIFSIVFPIGMCLLLFSSKGLSQEKLKSKVLWLTLDEAVEKSKSEERKILMFLYTDWCTWCKKLEYKTLGQNDIVDYINRNFYPVKFNAEEKERVQFKGEVYKFENIKPRGVHGLAIKLMGGRLNYPTIAFFDEKWELIQSIPNFQPPLKFEQIITYFGENYYLKVPWSSYRQTYQTLREKAQE